MGVATMDSVDVNTAVAQIDALPLTIARVAGALDRATTAAELLAVWHTTELLYTAAKECARVEIFKKEACHKAMADVLLIQVRAQCRFADEYDAAQKRGELNKPGRPNFSQQEKFSVLEELGLGGKKIHLARKVRDAEKAKPGLAEITLATGEPTRARLMRAVDEALTPPKPPPSPSPRQAPSPPPAQTSTPSTPSTSDIEDEDEDEDEDEAGEELYDRAALQKAWYLGFLRAAESIADLLETFAECENERNTPESKIRAAVLAESAAMARGCEKNARETLESPK
jgi:hypothetical protein